jgi:ATP-dependent Clp protease ATP-binding subunit ClpC
VAEGNGDRVPDFQIRFTDRARKVFALANQEAMRFSHEYIGTEHILLGLMKEGSGVGANVLKSLGVDMAKVRLEVEKLVKSGPDPVAPGRRPQTPRAKQVIEYAIEEASNLKHEYIGTEHLLLGLVRVEEGVAAQTLRNLGLTPEQIRAETLKLLGAGGVNALAQSPSSPAASATGPEAMEHSREQLRAANEQYRNEQRAYQEAVLAELRKISGLLEQIKAQKAG